MKKKNLIILLLMPFIIALFGIFTLNLTFNIIDNDILRIDWNYDETEGYSLREKRIELSAKAITDNNYPLQKGNSLVWRIENCDPETGKAIEGNPPAEFENGENEGETVYLIPLGPGGVKVTCSNVKGNIFRSMNIILIEEGTSAIILNPITKSSQKNIDPIYYYGQYDLNHETNQKESSCMEYSLKIIPEDFPHRNDLITLEHSNNIDLSIDKDKGYVKAKFTDGGLASFKLGYSDESYGIPVSKSFHIVDDGVNVYDYDDLLYCTNKSENGEIVVLRKSFESVQGTYLVDEMGKIIPDDNGDPQYVDDSVTLFGHIKGYNELDRYYYFDFENEIYHTETTMEHEFIRKWNEYARANKLQTIQEEIYVGLHVQKSFYGNGYTINFHNLAYPYKAQQIDLGNGTSYRQAILAPENLFRGPLQFYTVGNPVDQPLITAYGQDNVGFYIEGSNILVNDLNIKNCDFGDSLGNLDYTGTVLDMLGNSIEIRNTILSNGKNVARCFSSRSVVFNNCLFQSSRNFLLDIGNNKFVQPEDGSNGKEPKYDFYTGNGGTVNQTLSEYLKTSVNASSNPLGGTANGGIGDKILEDYLFKGSETDASFREDIVKQLMSIQDALDQKERIAGPSRCDVTLKDCYFYQSGIASIAMESYFNGPFLYSGSPGFVSSIFKLIQFTPDGLDLTNISGASYPARLIIEGKTAFYDYKVTETIDLSGLINENISETIKNFGKEDSVGESNINIDVIFKLKPYLVKTAKELGYTYQYMDPDTGIEQPYLNIPIAYYGGALNTSQVIYRNAEVEEYMTEAFPVDLLGEYLKEGTLDANTSNFFNQFGSIMKKCVNLVTGFHPFKFICYKGGGHDFEKTPDIQQLIINARENA